MWARRGAWISLVLLLLAGDAARAEDLIKAKAYFNKAETLYRLGKFAEALTQYQASYQNAQRPRLLFNMAQCHRNLGQLKKALFYYRLFRDDWQRRHPGTNPANHTEVEERIRKLEQKLKPKPPVKPATQPVKTPTTPGTDTDKTTGDKTTGDKTTGDKTTGDKTTGDKTTGDKTTGDKTTDPVEPPSRLRRPWAWITAGVGAAAIGVGVGLLATRTVEELQWHEDGPPTRETDSAVPGAVLIGAGVAACAVSTFLFLRGESRVQAGLGVTGHGMVASVMGRF